MIKKLKQIKLASLARIDQIRLAIIFLYCLGIFTAGVILNTIRFDYSFLLNSILHTIIIVLIANAIFMVSYKNIMRKSPSKGLIVLINIFVLLLLASTVMSVSILESVMHKSSLVVSSGLLLVVGLMLLVALTVRYDFAVTDSWKSFFITAVNHIKNNIGLFMVIMSYVSIVAYLYRSLVYPAILIPAVIMVYLMKSVVSNLRK